jgi:hypothetical protein
VSKSNLAACWQKNPGTTAKWGKEKQRFLQNIRDTGTSKSDVPEGRGWRKGMTMSLSELALGRRTPAGKNSFQTISLLI